ncbi:patatin-like phospholipase family protein [Dielma fastidiosa]|uniref:Patatin-like phospholipase family protein n=1 Tax=Dielma fastidiosa TaxID=1034346 RepID=A0AB35USQ4_9FIRM|nr:patatin-like phospholipase family protein [Dielma fastidiosa]MDY5169757.1 patatin-like phospholipase family protein [Dielma fastidiosa]
MKRAFVLAGGGSKGAYEIGFYKAIQELGIQPDIVTGTSIGALIGCMIAQNDYEEAVRLWENMDITQVMNNGISVSMNIDSLVTQRNRVVPFFKQFIHDKGADITPLKEMIIRLSDQERLLASPIDFGLVTVEYPSLKPVQITKHEMAPDTLKDYLIASASCYPAFPAHVMDGKEYVDGGYYDNLPVRLAMKMGADELVLVDLNHKKIIHEEYLHRPNIKYIIPSQDLGNFLDFDRVNLDRRIQLGYLDTMKAFNAYDGFVYTYIQRRTDAAAIRFYNLILDIEAELNDGMIRKKVKVFNPQPLTDVLRNYTRKQALAIKDYDHAAMEICAQILDIDVTPIYEIKELRKLIRSEFLKQRSNTDEIVEGMRNKNLSTVKMLLNSLNSKQILSLIVSQIMKSETYLFEPRSFFPLIDKEYVAALYLANMK